MEEEGRVHCFADRIVAAEREREVGHAAGSENSREVLLDPAHSFDEVDGVKRMLIYAGADGKYVHVEYDVAWRNSCLPGEEVVCTLADVYLSLVCRGLAILIEGHYDHGCS